MKPLLAIDPETSTLATLLKPPQALPKLHTLHLMRPSLHTNDIDQTLHHCIRNGDPFYRIPSFRELRTTCQLAGHCFISVRRLTFVPARTTIAPLLVSQSWFPQLQRTVGQHHSKL